MKLITMPATPDARRPTSVALGRDAEAQAPSFLLQQGLTLIEKIFRCPTGEIDLIMQDAHMLVFIEVRSRKDRRFGGAAASVGPVKQRRLWRNAAFYLLRFRQPPACRFDLVAIEADDFCWMKNIRLSGS